VSDLDIGMNDWMCKRLEWDDSYRPDRGKVLEADELERITRFSRYVDVDGDGITARTLPGVHPKGAYFTRGSGHDKHGAYTEGSTEYAEVMERIARKIASAASAVPAPEVRLASAAGAVPAPQVRLASAGGSGAVGAAGNAAAAKRNTSPGTASVGLITIGSPRAAVLEAVDQLADAGIGADFLRVSGFPFAEAVREFIDAHEHVFVIEQNRDAQLRSLLAIELGFARDRMISIRDFAGLPLAAETVVAGVTSHLQGSRA